MSTSWSSWLPPFFGHQHSQQSSSTSQPYNSPDLITRDGISQLASQVTAMARQAVESISGQFSSLFPSGTILQKTQDRLDSVQASWRWGPHSLSYSERVPFKTDPNERMLLAAVSLAKSVHDQVTQFGGANVFNVCPISLLVAGASVTAFYWPGGVSLRDVCLSPYCVVERGQAFRLLSPSLIHLDATHLLSNLAIAVPDMMALETSSGSQLFAVELIGLTAAAHGTYVAWAWGQKQIFNRRDAYYSVGAVGLSSLAFALQVVASERRASKILLPGGIQISSRFAWFLQLALSHVCTPDASFPGHMCGIAAGLLYVYALEPVLNLIGIRPRGSVGRWDNPATLGTGRFYGAGTTGGRVITSSAVGVRRRTWWKRWAAQLGSQLALVAVAAGVYVVSSRRNPSRRPINSWTW